MEESFANLNINEVKKPEVQYSGLELHKRNGGKIYMAVAEINKNESFVFSLDHFNNWFPEEITKRAECFYSYAIYNINQRINSEVWPHLDFGVGQYLGGPWGTFSDRIIIYIDKDKKNVEKVMVYIPGFKVEFQPEFKSYIEPEILSKINLEKLAQNYQLYMADAKIPANIKQYYLDALAIVEAGIKYYSKVAK